jgi:integrase
MAIASNKRLGVERDHVLGEIIENGKIVELAGHRYLMAPVSPMTIEFLSAVRLENRENNLGRPSTNSDWVGMFNADRRQQPKEIVTLVEAVETFIEQRKVNWGRSTLTSYQRVFGILFEVLGESLPLQDITPTKIHEVKNALVDLPRYHGTILRGKPIAVVLDVSKSENLRKRSVRTVNTELKLIGSFFEWAFSEWLIERKPTLHYLIPTHKNFSRRKRLPFTVDQMNMIFRLPHYTGCKDDKNGCFKRGHAKPRRGRFWIPLIALYSGMRAGEIIRLQREDVPTIDGIPCFVVGPNAADKDGQQLKNLAAERKIPVHSKLINLGFLNFLETKTGLLFDELGGKDHLNRVNAFSQWFNRGVMSELGQRDGEKTFHSFRHAFRDGLRDAEVPLEFVKEMGGWSRTRFGAEASYGSGSSVELLNRHLQKLQFKGLDISHLKQRK